MINLHNNTIITNKRKSYFLLTIYFLTLPNITNIIFSYDNDIFAMAEDSSRGSYARFSKEEDDQLRELVAIYENKKNKWSLIAEQMPGRDAVQCNHRWNHCLKYPDTKKGSFTQEEDELLMQKFQEFGTKWTTIAKYFSGRIPTSLKNRYDQMLRKGTIPVTQKQVVQQNLQVIDNTKDNTDFEFDFSDGMFDSFDNDYNGYDPFVQNQF